MVVSFYATILSIFIMLLTIVVVVVSFYATILVIFIMLLTIVVVVVSFYATILIIFIMSPPSWSWSSAENEIMK
jgi:hypothetical protein